LVPLAGALGVGTIFALFFGGLAMLAVGALVGLAAWLIDRLEIGREGRAEQRRLSRLYAAGYTPAEKAPRFVLPQADPVSTAGEVACWQKKGKSYLDLPGWLRLRGEAGSRWRALSAGEARPPSGATILADVKVGLRIPGSHGRAPSVARCVAIVDHQHVAVGVREGDHVADAAVHRLGEELDAL
jgi:hypothetical protein